MSWTMTPIKKIGEIFDGPHATPQRLERGEKYFLNISSLEGGQLDLTHSDFVSDEDFAQWTRRVTPRADDFLFSYETRLGDAALMPDGIQACLGRRMALIRPDQRRINPRFLLYTWRSPAFREQLAAKSIHGATVDRIPLKELGNWTITLPGMATQQAIGEVLGALDDKIAANAQALEVSNSLVRVLYSQLPLSPRTLGEIAHSARDFVSSGAETPGESYVALEHFDKRQMWLRRHADAAVATSTKTRFLPGDTLFGKLRPYFHKVAHASMSGICSTDILVVRPNSKSDTALVLAAASSDAVVEAAVMSSNGTRMPRAKWQDIASCRVPDPTDPQVRCFVQSVDAITARMDRATEENTTLTAVRDELLPQLMSGRITVKDAEKRVEEEV